MSSCRATNAKPLAAFVRSLDDDVVNAVGIRAAESAARAHLPEWEYDKVFDCDVWRPLLRWSEQDVIDIHTRHGLRPNPLYLDGARRVGCWPCIHTNKEELRFLADTDPAKVDEIRSLEREVAAAAAARRLADNGESYELLGYEEPTFFQAANPEMICRRCNGTGQLPSSVAEATTAKVRGPKLLAIIQAGEGEPVACPRCKGDGTRRGMWPIDKAVAWSKTSRGGRHLEMFAPERDGCVRWGLCDTGTATKDLI